MSNLLNDFDWKDYGVKHGLDSDSKCIEHAVRASVEVVEKKNSVFDWRRYIKDHPDLQRALGKHGPVHVNDATCHYLNHGRKESRKKYKLGTNEPYVYDFDWKMYDKLNPDVFTQRHRNVGEWHCFRHWCEYGYKTDRKTRVGKQLVVKTDASISVDDTINKKWRSELENIIGSYIDIDVLVVDATKTTFNAMKDNIDNNMLKNIYQNIDDFSKFIEPYKNVLFICSDYPGYGGAATNCDNLSKYYAKTHNVKSIYWTYSHDEDIKNNTSNQHTIVSSSKIQSTLETLTFKPDIIILKNSLACDLTKIFKCPTIFLVPGIYKNELNEHYTMLDTIEKQNKYINQSTLTQIRNSTYSFCNSSHTQYILNKWYNLNTDVFCSTFIQFYGQTIPDVPDFHNRKYDYGLVISGFTRQIKNVDKSIEFLKGKENVILIGNGSSKYKSHGFECIELVDNDKMVDYYKQIKYLTQHSHFESCSNVNVEGVFNGCKTKKIYNIVVSSTQYPGYGGAATNAYQIIKYLRQNGVNAVGVFFHDKLNVNYNPDNLEGILLYLYNDIVPDRVRTDVKTYLKADPNFCFAKNYIAPYICKKIFNCYTVYLVSGISHFYYYKDKSAGDFLNPNFIISQDIPRELQCNEICDKIVLNSKLSADIFNKIYPQFRSKISPNIVDTTQYINIRPDYNNNSKDFDIVIACSRLDRVDKNNLFLINILKNPIFNNHRKLIIGSNFDKFINIPNSECVGLCDHNATIDYLARSKVLLFPSLFDANSNTIREAIYNKCLPLITKNIGFAEAFPDCLICESYSSTEWVSKLLYILENYSDLKDTKFDFNTSKHIIDIMDLV
jgi:hypothetical protein